MSDAAIVCRRSLLLWSDFDNFVYECSKMSPHCKPNAPQFHKRKASLRLFWVVFQTDRQTDRQTNTTYNYICSYCFTGVNASVMNVIHFNISLLTLRTTITVLCVFSFRLVSTVKRHQAPVSIVWRATRNAILYTWPRCAAAVKSTDIFSSSDVCRLQNDCYWMCTDTSPFAWETL